MTKTVTRLIHRPERQFEWPGFVRLMMLGIVGAMILSHIAFGQTPAVLSSFHVVDVKNRGDIRPPVITGLFYDAARDILITAGDDHTIRVFKQPGDQQLVTLKGEGWIYGLALDPTGQYLAAVDDRGLLTVWKWESGQQLYRLPLSSAALRTVTFHPGGQWLAVAGFEPRLFLVETLTGRRIANLSGERDVRQVVFSKDGSLLAAAGGSGKVLLWETRGLQKWAEIPTSSRRLHAVAFSPDGRVLAAGGEDSTVSLWQLDSQPIQRAGHFKLPDGFVTSLTFCENGQQLAAGTTRNVIHLWDLLTTKELAQLQGHTGTISCLTWTPERSLLSSGSFDTTVRFWRLPPGTAVSERVPTTQEDDVVRQ